VYHPEGKKIVIYFLAMENSENTYTIERAYPFRVKNVTSEKIATISPMFLY